MDPFSGGLLLATLLAGATGTVLDKKVFPYFKDLSKDFDKKNEARVRDYLARGIEVPEAFAPTLKRIQEQDAKKAKELAKKPEDVRAEKLKQLLTQPKEDIFGRTSKDIDSWAKSYEDSKAIFAEQQKAEQLAYDQALADIMNNYEFGLLTTKEKDEAIKALKPVSKEFTPYMKQTNSLGSPLFLPNA